MKNLFCVFLFLALSYPLHCQIPSSGNVLWLKAGQGVYNDNGSTLATIGNTVQVWADQSGQGNDFIQPNTGQRPEYRIIPNVLCSQPVIYFDPGRETFLQSAMRLSGAKSIFIVFLMPAMSNSANDLLSLKTNADEFTEIVATNFSGYSPVTFIADLPSSAGGGLFMNSSGINTGFSPGGNILSFSYNGASITSSSSYAMRFDNTSATVTTSGLLGRYPGDVSTIGGRAPFQNINFLKGYIAEIIVYNRVLSIAETNDINNYLITKYGFFGTCSVLPLDLLDFNVSVNRNTINLSWKIADETSIREYIPEYSRDGSHWNPLDTLIALKNGILNQVYQWTDLSPATGNTYYRLRIQKTDGSFFYSATKKITLENSNDPVHLFPNPFINSIQIAAKHNEPLHVRIFTNDGKLVSNMTVISNRTVPLGHLSPGFYYAEIKGKNLFAIKKIIKQ
ncbi:MAG: T9SS type A sorting domain-containing protein [Chitinophagales bacterium]|nr:T9SS type A sorting domain-containing protein [Chitinophagales bacterium]